MTALLKQAIATITSYAGGQAERPPAFIDESLPPSVALCFVIDRTASMGHAIAAMNQTVPQLMHSVALTGVFDTMAILGYGDYDTPTDVVEWSGWQDARSADGVKALAKVSRMRARGGGGEPEAVKTALLELAKHAAFVAPPAAPAAATAGGGGVPRCARLHVLHITDAPPHELARLDNEGKAEKAALGADFDWRVVVQKLTAAQPNVRYTTLMVGAAHAFYVHLAAVTGGSVHCLAGNQNTAAGYRGGIAGILNGWLGLPGCLEQQTVFVTGPDASTAQQQLAVAAAAPDAEESAIMAAWARAETKPPAPCLVVRKRLMTSLTRMRREGPFREHMIVSMDQLLELDPMALTVSPILGRLYREICKFRDDPRRDALIEKLNLRKNRLPADERAVLEAWLKESYNAAEEIEGSLRDYMKANETVGLLRFVPEDERFCAQQMVQLLARGDKESTAMIRQMLGRMLVDTATRIPKLGDVEQQPKSPVHTRHRPEAAAAATARAAHVDPTAALVAAADKFAPLAEARTHLRAALVILLPPDASATVDVHRVALGDKAYPRWMPHITVAFPFLAPADFELAGAAIEAALAVPAHAVGPFDVELAKVSWFPGKAAVLHLEVGEAAKKATGQLHRLVEALLPQLRRKDRAEGEYAPHVTLGQCSSHEAAKRAAAIQQQWAPVKFRAAEMHLIVHADDAPAYTVVRSFKLAPPPPAASVKWAPPACPAWGADAENAAADGVEEEEEEEQQAALPLPDRSLPLSLGTLPFMELALHTVAPGTRLTRRYAALLSAHAVICGSVLAGPGKAYLEAVKGKGWINWARRADGTPEVPECFAPTFAALMLHPEVAGIALTPAEAAFLQHIQRVGKAMRYWHDVQLTVEMTDLASANRTLPDHVLECPQCKRDRPLSLFAADGVCGYCKENRGEDMPAADPDAQLQVRCCDCGVMYARNAAINIPGRSKCHGCHRLGQPSPFAECRRCHLHIAQYYRPEAGLPKGGVCGPCAAGVPPRGLTTTSHTAFAHQLFGAKGFNILLRTVGLAPLPDGAVELNPVPGDATESLPLNREQECSLRNLGLIDAITRVRACLPISPDDESVRVPEGGDSVVFRNARPANAAELWQQCVALMAGKAPERPECAVCLGTDERVQPACGRAGCRQVVCRECSVQWYGQNKRGCRLYDRALRCQFCARIPAPHVIRSVAPQLLPIVGVVRNYERRQAAVARGGAAADNAAAEAAAGPAVLDPAFIHAWCTRCDMPAPLAARECAIGDGGVADVTDFVCETCQEAEAAAGAGGRAADPSRYRECPQCTVTTQKLSGCNHITCSNCGAHWCWVCGVQTPEDEIYNHLETAHGTLYDWQEDDEEDEEEL